MVLREGFGLGQYGGFLGSFIELIGFAQGFREVWDNEKKQLGVIREGYWLV